MKTSATMKLSILGGVILVATSAHARGDFSVLATNNATVQPGGLRNTPNGLRFFNVEGSANNTFASFGVIDFQAPANTNVASISSLTLRLTQDNAGFTRNGGLRFFLTQDTTTNDVPGASGSTNTALTFQAASSPNGIGNQLSPNFALGTGIFTQGTTGTNGSGTVDTFTFNFAATSALATYLRNQINTRGDIRIIVAPDDANVAATYAGATNSSNPGPILSAVPEPTSYILLAIGGLVGLIARRRIHRAGAVVS